MTKKDLPPRDPITDETYHVVLSVIVGWAIIGIVAVLALGLTQGFK